MIEATTFAAVIEAVREQTAHLLGTTISYGEEDWAAPTPLQGWTRSHVAAHLVDNAHHIANTVEHLRSGPTTLQSHTPDERSQFEVRALEAAISLQIELDESAELMQRTLPQLSALPHEIQLSEYWREPATELATLRLREVVLHHHDLACVLPEDLPAELWLKLLAFESHRPQHRNLPPHLVVSDEGFSARLGSGDTPTTVMGPAKDLLLWLARDVVSPHVSGLDPTETG